MSSTFIEIGSSKIEVVTTSNFSQGCKPCHLWQQRGRLMRGASSKPTQPFPSSFAVTGTLDIFIQRTSPTAKRSISGLSQRLNLV